MNIINEQNVALFGNQNCKRSSLDQFDMYNDIIGCPSAGWAMYTLEIKTL